MKLVFATLVMFSTLSYSQDISVARKLFEEKKFSEAEKLLVKIDDNHKQLAEARYLLGKISFQADKLDDAQDYFEDAIDANENVADYHYWYGSTLGRIAQQSNTLKQGMLAPQIKEAFEKTVKLDPNNLNAHWGLIEFYTQAPGFMGGSWEKAEATAQAVVKINKGEGYRALAIVAERQDKIADAEKNFVAAAKSDQVYVAHLAAFYTRRKMNEKAFALFSEQLKKNPSDMLASYQFGRLSAITGMRLDEGESYLKKYLTYTPAANEPSHAGANMRLGQIAEKRGNKADAKRLYESALKQDATLKEAKEGLSRVK